MFCVVVYKRSNAVKSQMVGEDTVVVRVTVGGDTSCKFVTTSAYSEGVTAQRNMVVQSLDEMNIFFLA